MSFFLQVTKQVVGSRMIPEKRDWLLLGGYNDRLAA